MSSMLSESHQDLERAMRRLKGRDVQLWSLGFLIMLVLTSGILCIALPNFQSTVRLQVRYLPQLMLGLIALVLLLNFYLIDQRSRLERSRHQIVRRMAMQERADDFAVLDPLTHVFLRRYLQPLLDRELGRAHREGLPITFLMVKYEAMDLLVARFGRTAAELLVTEIAHLLRQNFRGADSIVRYNESAFLVVMPGTSEGQARSARLRMQEYVDRWNLHTPAPCEMTLGVSSAEYRHGMDAEQIIQSLANAPAVFAGEGRFVNPTARDAAPAAFSV